MSAFDDWFHEFYESYTFRPSQTEARPIWEAGREIGKREGLDRAAREMANKIRREVEG